MFDSLNFPKVYKIKIRTISVEPFPFVERERERERERESLLIDWSCACLNCKQIFSDISCISIVKYCVPLNETELIG